MNLSRGFESLPLRLALAALVALVAAGCGGEDAGAPGDAPVLAGAGFAVVSVDGSPAAGGAEIAFASDGTVSGSTGCNRFSGTYTYDPATGALALGALATTMMACEDALMAQEAAFTKAAAEVDTARAAGDGVELVAGDTVRIVLAPASADAAAAAPALAGTTYAVTAVDGTATAGGASIAFAADGTVSGSTGCNRFNGTYTYDPATGALGFGPLATTRMACDEALMAQEAAFAKALGEVDAARAAGTGVELVAGDTVRVELASA